MVGWKAHLKKGSAMKKIAWITDIHFDFIEYFMIERFLDKLLESGPDAVFITGDIGTAQRIETYLGMIEGHLACPVFFVLGNHDYYGGSFARVKKAITLHIKDSRHLTWMNTSGVIELSPQTGLFGHDGWADGRLGSAAQSNVLLNDFFFIEEFIGLSQEGRFDLLNRLGDQAAEQAKSSLLEGINKFSNLIMLTHVPPFIDVCLHEGHQTDEEFLPHFSSKAMGDMLVEVMRGYPDRDLTVLCGHAHARASVDILPNLHVKVGEADYANPQVEEILTIT